MSLVVLAFWATGLGWSESLRDARLSDAPMAGFISNIGIGAMFVAAFSALISLAFGGSARHLVLGLYCLVFALDDALLLHERLGALEVLAYAGYGLGFAGIWYLFAMASGRVAIWPLAVTFAVFVVSAVVDVVWAGLASHIPLLTAHFAIGYALEDIPKAVGIGVMAIFTVTETRETAVVRRTP